MSKYEVGDRFRSKGLHRSTAEIIHVVQLCDAAGDEVFTEYGILVTVANDRQHYQGITSQSLEDLWSPVPKKFFEENKTYRYRGENWDIRFRIVEVAEYRTFGNGIRRVALALRQYNCVEDPKLLNEDDFDNMVEVED